MANASRIQVRKDTAANWTSAAPTLAAGELGLDTDTALLRTGDGSLSWDNLPVMPTSNCYQVVTSATSYAVGVTATSLFPKALTLDANSAYEIEMNAVVQLAATSATTGVDALFQIKYTSSFSAIGGTGGVSSLYLTLAGSYSKIAVGMEVSGTGISGTPRVVAYDGSKTVTLSTFQTVSAGTTLTFSVTTPVGGHKHMLTVEGGRRIASATPYSAGGAYTQFLGSAATISSLDSDADSLLNYTNVVPLTSAVFTTANATSYYFTVKVKGIVITDATTLTNFYPSVDFIQAATPYARPTGTVYTQQGSYIKYTKLGPKDLTTVGSSAKWSNAV